MKNIITISSIKRLMLVAAMITVATSFCIQVKTMSLWPALLPYFFMSVVIILPYQRVASGICSINKITRMDLVVRVYIFFVLAHACWQMGLGVAGPFEAVSSVFIYAAPVLFYWYFRRRVSVPEMRATLLGIVLAGTVTGLFFAYESISKLGFGEVTQYSKDAVAYSSIRAPDSGSVDDKDNMRIADTFRSMGLLESHSVSGTWIAFGAFAFLALIPSNKSLMRMFVMIGFSVLLVIGFNFTSTIAFAFTLASLEFGLIPFVVPMAPKKPLLICSVVVGTTILFWVVISLSGGFLSERMSSGLDGQMLLLMGGGSGSSYSEIIVNNIIGYFYHLIDFPHTLIFGDGYTSYGLKKGGDIGYVEDFARFGIPVFVIILFGLVKICRDAVRPISEKVNYNTCDQIQRILVFSGSVILFLLVMNVHYSVWNAKSVLPIFFIALGSYVKFRPSNQV